jgi:hypothetical protein
VLVDTEDLNPGQPGRFVGQLGEQRGDRVPDGVPVHP